MTGGRCDRAVRGLSAVIEPVGWRRPGSGRTRSVSEWFVRLWRPRRVGSGSSVAAISSAAGWRTSGRASRGTRFAMASRRGGGVAVDGRRGPSRGDQHLRRRVLATTGPVALVPMRWTQRSRLRAGRVLAGCHQESALPVETMDTFANAIVPAERALSVGWSTHHPSLHGGSRLRRLRSRC